MSYCDIYTNLFVKEVKSNSLIVLCDPCKKEDIEVNIDTLYSLVYNKKVKVYGFETSCDSEKIINTKVIDMINDDINILDYLCNINVVNPSWNREHLVLTRELNAFILNTIIKYYGLNGAYYTNNSFIKSVKYMTVKNTESFIDRMRLLQSNRFNCDIVLKIKDDLIVLCKVDDTYNKRFDICIITKRKIVIGDAYSEDIHGDIIDNTWYIEGTHKHTVNKADMLMGAITDIREIDFNNAKNLRGIFRPYCGSGYIENIIGNVCSTSSDLNISTPFMYESLYYKMQFKDAIRNNSLTTLDYLAGTKMTLDILDELNMLESIKPSEFNQMYNTELEFKSGLISAIKINSDIMTINLNRLEDIKSTENIWLNIRGFWALKSGSSIECFEVVANDIEFEKLKTLIVIANGVCITAGIYFNNVKIMNNALNFIGLFISNSRVLPSKMFNNVNIENSYIKIDGICADTDENKTFNIFKKPVGGTNLNVRQLSFRNSTIEFVKRKQRVNVAMQKISESNKILIDRAFFSLCETIDLRGTKLIIEDGVQINRIGDNFMYNKKLKVLVSITTDPRIKMYFKNYPIIEMDD